MVPDDSSRSSSGRRAQRSDRGAKQRTNSSRRDGKPAGGRGKQSPRGSRSGRGDGRAGRDTKKFSPQWREGVDAPLTEAQRRAAEVDRRRGGPRPRRDPDADRRHAEERVVEEWIDEGSVRDAAHSAAARAATERPVRRAQPLDAQVQVDFADAVGQQRAERLAERLGRASEALDRERFDEARRIAASIAKEAPQVAAVQEVLGLASYRLGRYKAAVTALQRAQELHADPALLPVIADSYRGLRRWRGVERVWGEIKAASPAHEVMSEGRIVMANALADQGDIAGAIALMESRRRPPKRVRDHHLREWYVLGDLYDRSGEPIAARRWFSAVAECAPDFVDVQERLRSLGR